MSSLVVHKKGGPLKTSTVYLSLLAVALASCQTFSFPSTPLEMSCLGDSSDSRSSDYLDSTEIAGTPNSIYRLTRSEILSLPFRGTENYLPLFPGVVKQDGELHVRGGRAGEIGYQVEGMSVTNRFTNEDAVPIIPEAMEELAVSTGGYSAEFGGWNSGMVFTQLQTGGDHWTLSGNLRTDDFARPGNKFVGTSSFGYRDAVLTAGGPFPGLDNLKIFIAAEYNLMRDRQVMFLSPFEFDPATDMYDPYPGQRLPWPIFFKENSIPNNRSEATTVQGRVSFDLDRVTLRLVGSIDAHKQPDGSEWPDALVRFFNQNRTPDTKVNSEFLSLRMTHSPNTATSFEVAAAYYNRFSNTLDPDFGDNWRSYSDSLANAARGYGGFLDRWYGPWPYSIVGGFYLNNENTPNTTYNKSKQQSWSFSGTFKAHVNEHWEMKLGGNVETWTMRLFDVGYIPGVMAIQYGLHGENQQVFPDPITRRIYLTKAGLINNFGYDVDGNQVNNGPDAPRTPLFASAYVQNDVALDNFTLGLGLRYELYDLKDMVFTGMASYSNSLDAIDDTKLADREPSSLFLPRIALSYTADSKTVLSVQFGAYAQMPALNQIFNGNIFLSRTVIGDRLYATPAGYYAKPERTKLLQIGLARQLNRFLVFSATYYSKQMNNLLSLRKAYLPDWYGGFNAFLNDDHSRAKGLELALELMRSQGVAARLFYTLSEVRGTNSTPLSPRGTIELYQPLVLNDDPLDFNQTHDVTFTVDYLNPDTASGTIFSGFGVNTVLTFNSGHNYTRMKPVMSIGLVDPWSAGVTQLLDPRYAYPAEPRNNSVTPVYFNVDLTVSKRFSLGSVSLKAYVNVLNLFDAKQVLNVYPVTGSTDNDGWLENPLSGRFLNTPTAVDFYKTVNLQNRWAYMQATGNDIYGSPRQIRVGVSAEF